MEKETERIKVSENKIIYEEKGKLVINVWHTAHEQAMLSSKADARVVSFGLRLDRFAVTTLKHNIWMKTNYTTGLSNNWKWHNFLT
jgi:hypothetical protein